jgi:hypothetical protein
LKVPLRSISHQAQKPAPNAKVWASDDLDTLKSGPVPEHLCRAFLQLHSRAIIAQHRGSFKSLCKKQAALTQQMDGK